MRQYKILRSLGCNESKALEIIENYTPSEINIIIQKLNEKARQQQQQQNESNNQLDKYYVKGLELFKLKSRFTTKELRKGYKDLSLRFHPDKCGTNKYFTEITKYYEFCHNLFRMRKNLIIWI